MYLGIVALCASLFSTLHLFIKTVLVNDLYYVINGSIKKVIFLTCQKIKLFELI